MTKFLNFAKFLNFYVKGKGGEIFDGINGIFGGGKAAAKLRGQVRSQVKLGNEGTGKEGIASCAPALEGAPGQRVARATEGSGREIME